MPDVITSSTLFGTCEKDKQPERALEMFQALQRQGVVPDFITFNALISVCEKTGQPLRCFRQCSGKAWCST